MGAIKDKYESVYRDYATDGVQSSGPHNPGKREQRSIGLLIEDAIANAALGAIVDVAYAARAELEADLAHADGSVGLVYSDAVDANNDIYLKSGESGSGAWVLTSAFHDIIEALAEPFRTRAANSVPFETWADLDTAIGMVVGDRASVRSSDTGTHNDPVTSETVPNYGLFEYSNDPEGWERVDDLESVKATAQVALANDAADLAVAEGARVIPFVAGIKRQSYADDWACGFIPEGPHTVADNAVAQVTDRSGAGNHAAQSAPGERPTLSADGVLLFDGTDQNLEIPHEAIDESGFSVAIRFQVDSFPQTNTHIIGRGNPAGTSLFGWSLEVNNGFGGRFRFTYRNASNVRMSTPWVSLSAGVPIDVIVVYEDGVGAKLFTRGALAAKLETAETIEPASALYDTTLGAAPGGSLALDGEIHYAALFATPLTENQCRDFEAVIEGSSPDASVKSRSFVFDNVIDTSGDLSALPEEGRESLTAIGGELTFDADGAAILDERSLIYYLPSATRNFGVGFSFRPRWDWGSPPVSQPRFLEIFGRSVDGAAGSSPSIMVRQQSNSLRITTSGYGTSTFAQTTATPTWSSDDQVECYVAFRDGYADLYIYCQKAREGTSVDVISLALPADFEAIAVKFGHEAGTVTADSAYNRAQIDLPPHQPVDPGAYFGLKVEGDPLMVVTFDDSTSTDYTDAFPIMTERGLVGTSSVITGTVGSGTDPNEVRTTTMNWGQVVAMHDAGWDMQCHTDQTQPLTALTLQEVADTLDAVDSDFAARGIPRPVAHAYPQGQHNQDIRGVVMGRRKLARSVNFGINTYAPPHGSLFAQVPDFSNAQAMKDAIDHTVRVGGVTILLMHELDNREGNTTGTQRVDWFEEVMDYAAERIRVVSMRELVLLLGPRNAQGYYSA